MTRPTDICERTDTDSRRKNWSLLSAGDQKGSSLLLLIYKDSNTYKKLNFTPKVNKTVQLMSPGDTEKNQVQNRLSYVSYKVTGLGAIRTLKIF